MIGIALDMHDRRRHIPGSIAERMDDDAAADRAVRTRRSRLGGPGDLQLAYHGVGGRQVEAEYGSGHAANRCRFQELPASGLHHVTPPSGGLSPFLQLSDERTYFLQDFLGSAHMATILVMHETVRNSCGLEGLVHVDGLLDRN